MRVMTSSRSPASAAVLALASIPLLLLLRLQLAEVLVQAIEAFFPKLPVVLQPIGSILQRTRCEPAGPPLRLAAAFDQTGALQHLEVLGYRGKAHRERLGEFSDGNLTRNEARQD